MRNEWAGGNEGKSVSNRFQFCVCYVTKGGSTYYTFSDSEGNHVKGGIKLMKGYGSADMSKEFKVVDWSQEREDFLTRIQAEFVKLNEKLETFLGDLNGKKLDELMKTQMKLLSN